MGGFLEPGDRVLFQGDSITDAGREGSPDGLGQGYVAMARGLLELRWPGSGIGFVNRGTSGDRSVELLARWERDCLALEPDVLSIMVGVNDVWRILGVKLGQGYVEAADYEENCRRLLVRARTAGIARLVLMSPTSIDEEADATIARHLDERAAIVRSLAAEFDAVYVPTRETQKRALAAAPGLAAWTTDGCHPGTAGHALIAAAWVEAVLR